MATSTIPKYVMYGTKAVKYGEKMVSFGTYEYTVEEPTTPTHNRTSARKTSYSRMNAWRQETDWGVR